MARTAIAINNLAGGKNPANATLSMTAGDASNDHSWAAKAGDMLFVHNEGVGSVNVTLVSVADRQGRTGDVSLTVAADQRRVFGPISDLVPWLQSGGVIHVDTDTDTDPKLAVLRP